MDDAASPSATGRRRPRPKVSPVKRILGLLRRLTEFAMDLREAAQERVAAEVAKAEAGGNADPYFMDSLLDFRLHHLIQRLIGLTARFELRRMSERGKARANAPGAAEKRRLAAQKRAEAKAAFVRETGLDVRYMPLTRPLGVPPPPRRSKTWHFRKGWADLIEGETDAEVVRSCVRELAEIAGLMGEEPVAMQAEALEPLLLAEIAVREAWPAPVDDSG